MRRTAIDTTLMVFARAPRPGEAKTRLVPLLGADGAAALHAQLVAHTLATARASGLRPLELHCSPDTQDPFFASCAAVHDTTLVSQSSNDLGERMRGAFERALDSSRRAVLIGTDCPVLTAHHLRETHEALAAGNDAVFAPTEDGGYALIGLARCDARLFDAIPWGTDTVMSVTRGRLAAMGWRWHELETLWDLDRPGDYGRLVACGLADRLCNDA